MAELLTSIQTGSGTPVFEPLTNDQLRLKIDSFTSNVDSITGADNAAGFIRFTSDVMVVNSIGDSSVYDDGTDTISYDYYQKGTYPSIETKLRYNYNMTTGSVDITFTNILGNIIKELSPPKTSKTFAYDFKFSQNQNASISGSRPPSIARGGSSGGTSGGGY